MSPGAIIPWNELLEQIRLLLASVAGHTNHINEVNSIIEELKVGCIIVWNMNFATDVKWEVKEIFRPAKINFERRTVILNGLNDMFDADSVDMQGYYRENKGYKYILVVINCFSKFVWTLPLKTKTGQMIDAMEKTVKKKNRQKICRLTPYYSFSFTISKN